MFQDFLDAKRNITCLCHYNKARVKVQNFQILNFKLNLKTCSMATKYYQFQVQIVNCL